MAALKGDWEVLPPAALEGRGLFDIAATYSRLEYAGSPTRADVTRVTETCVFMGESLRVGWCNGAVRATAYRPSLASPHRAAHPTIEHTLSTRARAAPPVHRASHRLGRGGNVVPPRPPSRPAGDGLPAERPGRGAA